MLSPLCLFKVTSSAGGDKDRSVRFDEDDTIVKDLANLEEQPGTRARAATPLGQARRAVWGTLYADDGSIVSRSFEGLEMMMTIIIVEGVRAFGLTASEKKTQRLSG